MKLMIVDDSNIIRNKIERTIQSDHKELTVVGTAKDGMEAVQLFRDTNPDIVTMDLTMPKMDGIETTKAIRESGREYSKTPIIALTADVSAENNAECMAAGVDIFLTKPIKSHDLIEAMRYVLLMQGQDNNLSLIHI